MSSPDPIIKLESELDFRTEKLAEALEELDARVQHLEARLDSLILILQKLEASSLKVDQESS